MDKDLRHGVIGNESLGNKSGKDTITELLADTLDVNSGKGLEAPGAVEGARGNS